MSDKIIHEVVGSTTTDGQPPDPAAAGTGAPQLIDPVSGQHKAYWVLTQEERDKGFVRPVRDSYVHVGAPRPRYPLLDLTEEQKQRYQGYGYVKFEAYPDSELPITGRYWTQKDLDEVGKGCRQVTTMGRALSETYARDPSYYGSTFCAICRTHLPVGAQGQFVWSDDGTRVGT